MGTGKRSFLEAGVASEPAELRGGAGAGTLRESVGAGRGRPTGTRVFSCLHVARGAGRSGPRRGGTGTLGAGSAHVIPRRLPRGRRGGGGSAARDVSAERAGVAPPPGELPWWGGVPKGFGLLVLLMGTRSAAREMGLQPQ